MLDCQLFGLNAAGHHFVNILFHAANAVLLFLLLKRLTGATWRSALVAALFAWHPLHVESVAWAAERKDVLSGFFWMLTLLAYVRYAQMKSLNSQPSTLNYFLALFFFACGLMSKADGRDVAVCFAAPRLLAAETIQRFNDSSPPSEKNFRSSPCQRRAAW